MKKKLSQDESIQIFKLRSRMTPVKIKYRNSHESYECEACKIEDETQEHLMLCEEIMTIQNHDEKNDPN